MHLNMSGEMHMLRRNDEVFGCIPHGRGAYRESDSFAMWAVHHGVTVSMTTISISSDSFTHCVTLTVSEGSDPLEMEEG